MTALYLSLYRKTDADNLKLVGPPQRAVPKIEFERIVYATGFQWTEKTGRHNLVLGASLDPDSTPVKLTDCGEYKVYKGRLASISWPVELLL